MDKNQFILIATLKQPHGLQGQLNIIPHGANPNDLLHYKQLWLSTQDKLTITKITSKNRGYIASFAEIKDRNQADQLINSNLYIHKEQLPNLEEDEFYYQDLEDCQLLDLESNPWGKVVKAMDFGAGTILEIRKEQGKTALIPFNKYSILRVDLENKTLVIDPVAAGLAE